MKAIMYHYVQEYNNKLPYFRYLDFENFKKQLDYFQEKLGFVTKSNWIDFIQGKKSLESEKGVILTFDDGLISHYRYVYPELISRNLWGIFYVPSKVIDNNTILDVHKIHLLVGLIPERMLMKKLLSVINEDMIPDNKIVEFREKTYLKHIDSADVKDFKRILNYYIDYRYRSSVINHLAVMFNIDFTSYKNFYMNSNQLLEMSENGMIIGSHTVNHPLMSKLDYNYQEKEIGHSIEKLESTIHEKIKTYCHPYGGYHSFNELTLQALEEHEIDYSFNVESRDISLNDMLMNPHALPRFDCNQFDYGQISKGNG